MPAIAKTGLALALILSSICTSASAQEVKVTNNGLKGVSKAFSASVAPDTSATLFTTPPADSKQAFVVTTACGQTSLGVTATGFGRLNVGLDCGQYPTGIVLPPDANVVCDNTGNIASGLCIVSGVMAKAKF